MKQLRNLCVLGKLIHSGILMYLDSWIRKLQMSIVYIFLIHFIYNEIAVGVGRNSSL